ncbi:chromosome segregation protein SMC [Bacillus sp. CGMCC 1.16607]|uniref:chromosome segregation protein SMC n=1 Tax=Bacillus sp. CGMCC 1.16607 TaxID=3351842 RepID=UPI0036311266
MFLKRLEVVGFKSFAERSVVEFVPGVTAVVGPNGSGKSNITDAIRWVLGEQSAKSLRGGKMEDIIFAGSDSRKSLNFAEVTLTLDNEDHFLPIDYSEVSVTRRVYRSGDSEYLINRQSSRLKDIVDLFMDSGLGREAFSIISQGRVEEILNSKAEERRTIFEEAAGVLKYKTRKKKAEGKLTETQENLNRVNDILHELEVQVEPLKFQASIAKDFSEKKVELEKYEVALTVYDIEELHRNWESISKQFEQHKDDDIKLSADLQKKEATIEELRDHITALDESISDLQNVLLHTSEELEKLEGRKEVLKERKKNSTQNREQLEKNIKEFSEKIQTIRVQKSEQESIFLTLEKEAKQIQEKLNEKREQSLLFSENIDEKIESLKSEYIDKLNEQANCNNETKYIDQQLEQQGKRALKLEDENGKYLSERKLIFDKKLDLQSSISIIQNEIEEQVYMFRESQKKLDSLKNNYQSQEKTLYQAYQFLQQAKSRKEMLEEMEEDFSGFFQGVKEVLKARGTKLNGIKGAIAELINVPKEYELAIETALGGAMQHIVVENEESGRLAIQYLKQNAFGRATFLPMNILKGKSLSATQLQMIQGHSSYIGTASDLIQFDSPYKEIVLNLLGNVIITKDLKGANEIAKILQYRSRLVTLEGDIVNPGGSMTGGASKQKTSSLLSRKGELEELKKKLFDMEDKTSKLEDLVKKFKLDIEIQEGRLEVLRKNGEQLRLKEQSLKGNLREIEVEEKNINERLSLYDIEMKQFSEEKESLINRKELLHSNLVEIANDITQMDQQLQQLNTQRTTEKSSKEILNEEISELKVAIAAKKEQLTHTKERLLYSETQLSENEELLLSFEEDLSILNSDMNNSHSGEAQLEIAAKKKLQDKNETIKLISTRREERLKLSSLLEDTELEAKELKRQYKGLVEAIKDEEVKLNRLDVELENKLSHLREEYLLSFEGAKEQFSLEIPMVEARKKVKLIKLAIEELGTVNLGAIEEYERVSERYEFLLEQKTDLHEAKDTLFQVIDEMDEEMKKRFSQTFSGIKTHFEPVFQALFGGGRADLKLTNPEDLLNTGVEIVAQPPGKKLQNLGLLSGGERALTAIALLFAILKVRPVPFCVLDEVEAALDDANVFRFSQYLKRYSVENQFIVITHRKGTMEGADVLYGVTMQESGVSKLVSVRLEDSKELVQ